MLEIQYRNFIKFAFLSDFIENNLSGESRQGIATGDVNVAFNGINDSKNVGVDDDSSGNSRQRIAAINQ